MPISVCRPSGPIADDAWVAVDDPEDGLHFEIRSDKTIAGFVLSGTPASKAGGHYQRLGAKT